MIARPCLGCQRPIPSGSRCPECKLPDRPRTRTTAHAGSDWRWRKLSARIRQLSPFCEIPGCKSTDLTVDHRIPISEMPELAYEELNCRVLCRSHNATKGATVTDADKQTVLDAIAKRRARRNAYYRWKLGNGIGPL